MTRVPPIGSGGGLILFEEVDENGSKLIAVGEDANINVILKPKGNGAFQLDDEGAIRGDNAVDLQMRRSAASSIASGNVSVVSGGGCNIASGGSSVVSGGYNNEASGSHSVVSGGRSNTASGMYSAVSGGNVNTASGSHSAVSSGRSNTANANYSVVSGGYQTLAYLKGMEAFALVQFSTKGDAQRSDLVAKVQTTDGTQTKLTLDNDDIVIPDGKVWRFRIDLVAKEDTSGNVYSSNFVGAIKRIGGTTELVGSVVEENVMRDTPETDGWDVTVEADDTNDELQILVTGEADTTIRWVAHIHNVEVL